MTAVWVVISVAASWGLRKRPDVAAVVIFALWTLVPAQAGEVLTGVTFFTPSLLNLHPAAYFTYIYALLALAGGTSMLRRVAAMPGVLLVLVWVVALAGGLTALQASNASPRGFVGNFLAGALWLGICALGQQSNKEFGRWLATAMLAIAAANALLSITQSFMGEVWPYTHFREMYQADFIPGADRTSGSTDHPLVLSLLLAGALPLVVMVRRVLISYSLAVLLVVGLLQSGSRAGLVIGVLGYSAALLMSGRPNLRSIAVYLLTAASGLILYASTVGRSVAARFANDAGSNADRAAAYDYLFSHLGQYVFAGTGYGSSFSLKNSQVISSSFENAYAMLVVDLGLIAAGAFLLVQVLLLRRGWRRGVPRPLVWSAVTTMGVAATFSSFAVTSACMVLVWAPIAVVMATGGPVAPAGQEVGEQAGNGRVTSSDDGRWTSDTKTSA